MARDAEPITDEPAGIATTLILQLALPAFGAAAHLTFAVRPSSEQGILGTLPDIVCCIAKECGDDLLDVDCEGTAQKLEDLRKRAQEDMVAWQTRVRLADEWRTKADEWRMKADQASSKLNSMRIDYYKELTQLREQLYQKEKADKANTVFQPSNTVLFSPATSDEADEAVSAMQREHSTELEDIKQNHAARVEELKNQIVTSRMLLSMREKHLQAFMKSHGYTDERRARQGQAGAGANDRVDGDDTRGGEGAVAAGSTSRADEDAGPTAKHRAAKAAAARCTAAQGLGAHDVIDVRAHARASAEDVRPQVRSQPSPQGRSAVNAPVACSPGSGCASREPVCQPAPVCQKVEQGTDAQPCDELRGKTTCDRAVQSDIDAQLLDSAMDYVAAAAQSGQGAAAVRGGCRVASEHPMLLAHEQGRAHLHAPAAERPPPEAAGELPSPEPSSPLPQAPPSARKHLGALKRPVFLRGGRRAGADLEVCRGHPPDDFGHPHDESRTSTKSDFSSFSGNMSFFSESIGSSSYDAATSEMPSFPERRGSNSSECEQHLPSFFERRSSNSSECEQHLLPDGFPRRFFGKLPGISANASDAATGTAIGAEQPDPSRMAEAVPKHRRHSTGSSSLAPGLLAEGSCSITTLEMEARHRGGIPVHEPFPAVDVAARGPFPAVELRKVPASRRQVPGVQGLGMKVKSLMKGESLPEDAAELTAADADAELPLVHGKMRTSLGSCASAATPRASFGSGPASPRRGSFEVGRLSWRLV